MKKSINNLKFLFIFSALFLNQALAEEIEIKHADSLQADKEHISIKGNVLINYKDAVIEAPEAYIETDSSGEQDKAIFTHRGKLKLKDRKLEADKITVSIKDKTIIAEGNTNSELKDKKKGKPCRQSTEWTGHILKIF